MTGRGVDLTGAQIGDLRVLGRAPAGRWLCRCRCGATTEVLTRNLRSHNTRSCGNHPPSTGDDPLLREYRKAHARVTRERGPARDRRCESCGQPAHEWAFDWHRSTDVRRQTTLDGYGFSHEPADYRALCWHCHRRSDPLQKAEREAHERGARPLWEPEDWDDARPDDDGEH